MPGRKDRDHPLASYMTPYAANRSGINAADAAGAPSANIIDLSTGKTVDAVNNLIYVTARRTAGTGTHLDIELWQNCPGSSIDGLWRKVDTATLYDLDEKRFEAVYAAQYKLRVNAVQPNSTWTLHESHSEYEA